MRLLLLFFVVYLVALTFPGIQPFNRIEPFVLGVPFAFAWVILWVLLGWGALTWRYLADRRRER